MELYKWFSADVTGKWIAEDLHCVCILCLCIVFVYCVLCIVYNVCVLCIMFVYWIGGGRVRVRI